MSVRKSDDFIADVEGQFQWYAENADWEVAESYLATVKSTCDLLGRYPELGPRGRFTHPRLRGWRFFATFRPFQKHLLFYEITGDDVVMRRAMHGPRDLP